MKHDLSIHLTISLHFIHHYIWLVCIFIGKSLFLRFTCANISNLLEFMKSIL